MSFGVSVGDAFAVGNFAWKVYKACKSAPSEFSELSKNVASLHTAIREVSDEVRNADSVLNRSNHQMVELEKIMTNCHSVLADLEQLLTKHGSLGNPDASGKRKAWDRLKFGTKDLNSIRENLVFHTSTISLFLQTLGTGSLGRIETRLDELIREVRQGTRESTTIMIFGDQNDAQDVCWTGLQNAVQDEGITRSELDAHQNGIRAYLQEQAEKFDLPIRGHITHGSSLDRTPEPDQNNVCTGNNTENRCASPDSKRRKLENLTVTPFTHHLLESPSSLDQDAPPNSTITDHNNQHTSQSRKDFSTWKEAMKPSFSSDGPRNITEASERSIKPPFSTRKTWNDPTQFRLSDILPPWEGPPPHRFEPNPVGALEETSTDVCEYDDQGRLRKRIITRRSSNASLHSHGSMTPPLFPTSRQSPSMSPNTSIWESQSPCAPTSRDKNYSTHIEKELDIACARQIGEVDTSMHTSFADRLRVRLEAVLESNRIHERNFSNLVTENLSLRSDMEELKANNKRYMAAMNQLIEQNTKLESKGPDSSHVSTAMGAEARSKSLSDAKEHYKMERDFFRHVAVKLGWNRTSRPASPPSP